MVFFSKEEIAIKKNYECLLTTLQFITWVLPMNNIWWYQRGLSCQRVELFPSLRKKLDYLYLKDFLKYKCELYLLQPLTPPQHNIIATYCTL